MLHFFYRLRDARPMAGRHPPHHKVLFLEVRKPFSPPVVKPFVDGLVDKPFKRLDAFPYRQIDGYARVRIWSRAGRVATLVDIAPNETRGALREPVHQRQIVCEVCHPLVVDLVSNAADVQLRKVMIGWLLQGPTPSPISVMNSRRRHRARRCVGSDSYHQWMAFEARRVAAPWFERVRFDACCCRWPASLSRPSRSPGRASSDRSRTAQTCRG